MKGWRTSHPQIDVNGRPAIKGTTGAPRSRHAPASSDSRRQRSGALWH